MSHWYLIDCNGLFFTINGLPFAYKSFKQALKDSRDSDEIHSYNSAIRKHKDLRFNRELKRN